MNCPKCNKPNREKAVFCKWCGTNVVTKATEPLRELVPGCCESIAQELNFKKG